MNWWQAIILGLVEGITEFLPVSSTGHLIIASDLMGLGKTVDTYNIVIQGGAILAVLGLYRKRVQTMIAGIFGRDPGGRRLFINLCIAFLPAAILGPILDDTIEKHLFSTGPVLSALALGGVVMILLTPWQRRVFQDGGDSAPESPDQRTNDAASAAGRRRHIDIEQLTWRQSLFIGSLQCIAMWPGTSRSMMTIVGGMLVGLRPKQAAEFSFLLGLPTLGGACVYKIAKDVTQASGSELAALDPAAALIGIAVATVSAAVAIRWLVGFLSKHGVAAFGWYRIALAAVLAGLIATNMVSIGQDRNLTSDGASESAMTEAATAEAEAADEADAAQARE